jgi:hypothetical protein
MHDHLEPDASIPAVVAEWTFLGRTPLGPMGCGNAFAYRFTRQVCGKTIVVQPVIVAESAYFMPLLERELRDATSVWERRLTRPIPRLALLTTEEVRRASL